MSREQRIKRIEQLRARGLSYHKIAKMMGMKMAAVFWIIHREGNK